MRVYSIDSQFADNVEMFHFSHIVVFVSRQRLCYCLKRKMRYQRRSTSVTTNKYDAGLALMTDDQTCVSLSGIHSFVCKQYDASASKRNNGIKFNEQLTHIETIIWNYQFFAFVTHKVT